MTRSDNVSEAGIISTVLAALGGVVWAVRIEGKVLSHDKELAQLRDDARDDRVQVRTDLAYIRSRLDELTGRK